MWSTSGSAATYPSAVVPLVAANFTTPAGGAPLTVRMDPSSRIAYIVGLFQPSGAGLSGGALSRPLPAQFRPITTQWLPALPTNASSYGCPVQLTPDGVLYVTNAVDPTYLYALDGYYFTDV